MKTYRYRLEPYKGVGSRYTCPQCGKQRVFVRYIDTYTNQHLGNDIGRCNREVECGYHKKAGRKNEKEKVFNAPVYTPPALVASVTATEVYSSTMAGYEHNHLVQFLAGRLGASVVAALVQRYGVGTHKYWPGSTVFWQRDIGGRIRGGKVMLYDAHSGRRVKQPYNHISWVRRIMQQDNYTLVQCLFGEHLLKGNTLPVAIVESEKTALIAAALMPQYLWLASGSVGNLSPARCKVLHGHKVILYPDAGVYDRWAAVAAGIPGCRVSRLLETGTFSTGYDIADWLLESRDVFPFA